MNLTKLFEIQKELDEAIIKKKGLEGKDLLQERILALLVELGECANEWRGFKFWSENNSPKPPQYNWRVSEDGLNKEWIPEWGYESYPLLEEYVDCLHFFLSIGISIGHTDFEAWEYSNTKDETKQFLAVFGQIDNIKITFEDKDNIEPDDCVVYEAAFAHFLALGKMLGFTWGEIEQAYLQKNEINHKRQETGY
ncbi:hypothetical protein J32TS2_28530 [Shouchella clausii]|uniref:dUTP diphosphatase n=1 Tax=Shouchella clausii TaxID=79880 RepID=UPI001B02FB3F|nr:dUTP diphosphatase [Shouchella clausii]GIN17497.1 hypothetical protein J32TS2_28530 [Shouchella clausii]